MRPAIISYSLYFNWNNETDTDGNGNEKTQDASKMICNVFIGLLFYHSISMRFKIMHFFYEIFNFTFASLKIQKFINQNKI